VALFEIEDESSVAVLAVRRQREDDHLATASGRLQKSRDRHRGRRCRHLAAETVAL